MRTSSCVNLSNRLRASSISVFPNSFFRYFSDQPSVEPIPIHAYGKLTRSSLSYLLCSDSENIQYFHHNLHDDVRHCRRRWDLRIRLQTFEEVLDALKNVDEGVLRCFDILDRLTSSDVKIGSRRDVDNILTWRRTPAPAKITDAGEKTYIVTVKL